MQKKCPKIVYMFLVTNFHNQRWRGTNFSILYWQSMKTSNKIFLHFLLTTNSIDTIRYRYTHLVKQDLVDHSANCNFRLSEIQISRSRIMSFLLRMIGVKIVASIFRQKWCPSKVETKYSLIKDKQSHWCHDCHTKSNYRYYEFWRLDHRLNLVHREGRKVKKWSRLVRYNLTTEGLSDRRHPIRLWVIHPHQDCQIQRERPVINSWLKAAYIQ